MQWDQPYAVHLGAVRGCWCRTARRPQVVGFLHDVVEDAGVSVERVREGFGDLVAECVVLVTDPPGLDRAGREGRG